jgi:hypothetical protein
VNVRLSVRKLMGIVGLTGVVMAAVCLVPCQTEEWTVTIALWLDIPQGHPPPTRVWYSVMREEPEQVRLLDPNEWPFVRLFWTEGQPNHVRVSGEERFSIIGRRWCRSQDRTLWLRFDLADGSEVVRVVPLLDINTTNSVRVAAP